MKPRFLLLIAALMGLGLPPFELYSVDAAATQFNINVSSFIPYDHLDLGLCPIFNEVYGGDNRGFSSSASSYRTRQLVTVRIKSDPIIVEAPINAVLVTKKYNCSAVDDDTVKNDTPVNSGTADPSGMSITASRVSASTIAVGMSGSVRNPCVFDPFCAGFFPVTPYIDWCYTIRIFTRPDGSSGFSITGGNDNFPSYEVYINGQPIHQFAPATADPSLLFGGCGDVPVASCGSLAGIQSASGREGAQAGDACPLGVGGVAELPEVAGTPLDGPSSSGLNVALLATIAAVVATGVVSLGGAAWYARWRG